MTFTHLDLFAGVGGFSRAVHWLGGTTVGFVEWDSWNRRVLAKHWPEAQFHGDIGTLTADTLRSWGIRTVGADSVRDAAASRRGTGRSETGTAVRDEARRSEPERRDSGEPLTLLTGGYPCQPFSHAGKRLGTADDRHLWPEMRRILNLTRPRWVLAENVAGHVTMGLDTVLAELEADGYTCGAVVVPACAVNALHRRDRVWIMAHATSREQGQRGREQWRHATTQRGGSMADAGQGDGGRWAVAAGGYDTDRDHAGWEEATGGIDERGEGAAGGSVADPQGERGRANTRSVGESATAALRDAEGERHLVRGAGWSERESCGDGSSDRGRAERQIVGSVDIAPHGIPERLVRRPAARSAWDDPDLIRAMWADGSWEADLPRVVAEEAERRQKLQAAGNAIVPIVAYEILRVMLGSEDDCA